MKLKVEGVEFDYDGIQALNDVSLSVESGEVLGVVGPNGSGKTTLLRCINRILKPRVGSVLIDGDEVSGLGREEIAKKVGHVPQSGGESLPATVFDTILMGRKPYINWRPNSKDLEIVSGVIEKLGLEDLAGRDVGELSGGQRQKVKIARALAQEPEVLLLDEPTSDLDLKHQIEVMDLVKEQAENGISSLLAIHDLNLAAWYSNKVVMLKDGEVHAAGGPDVLTRESIEQVYGVEASVRNDSGRTVILPRLDQNR